MKDIYTAALVAISVLLISCNTDQLPVGAKVSVSPAKKSIRLEATDLDTPVFCFIDSDTLYQDVPVLISVTDAQGTPMGRAEVGVYADYSGNTFSGPKVLQIFADKNSNGVVDEDTELVSGSESGVYKTKTDRYDGTAMVFVRMNLTCPYLGELYVFVGSASTQVEFEVLHDGSGSTGSESDAGTTGGDTTAGGTTEGESTGSDTTSAGTTGAGTTDGATTGSETTSTATAAVNISEAFTVIGSIGSDLLASQKRIKR